MSPEYRDLLRELRPLMKEAVVAKWPYFGREGYAAAAARCEALADGVGLDGKFIHCETYRGPKRLTRFDVIADGERWMGRELRMVPSMVSVGLRARTLNRSDSRKVQG